MILALVPEKQILGTRKEIVPHWGMTAPNFNNFNYLNFFIIIILVYPTQGMTCKVYSSKLSVIRINILAFTLLQELKLEILK